MGGSYGSYDIPTYYDHINAYNARMNPSEIHAKNTGLQRFFCRLLLQRAISQFKWKLPKNWESNYFLYVLYCWGYIGVINTDKFGVIPQGCTLKGYGVQYQPTNIVVSNPLIRRTLEPTIGVNCTLIKMQPDYCGVLDIVNFYADMIAMTAEASGFNLINSKLAYVFASKNKAGAESFKKMFDDIASGQPATFVDNKLFGPNGEPQWMPFNNGMSSNFIVLEIMEAMQKWVKMFDIEIGIPATNTEKKERLVTGEVNSNAMEGFTRCEMWLENLKDGCERTNKMFGTELSVDWRVNPMELTASARSIAQSDEERTVK